ncbi:hypothetical protein [Thermodesulfobacterium hydrogeniphilum]|uniref:hypothetical protein n=1 Tax=Thermodesulfobacterium hydrogeniphilum TaxID=161156 RepID=UPI00068A6DBB|nr:hypothetical protein [Thermodesulfobacterium hydrogeniphilum]
MNYKKVLLGLGAVILTGGLCSVNNVFSGQALNFQNNSKVMYLAKAEKGSQEKVQSVYNFEAKPLNIEECARCHYSIFKLIKEQGGKHKKVKCTDCHTQFHVYNPVKKNWAEIMPKCTTCHGLIHGGNFTACLSCHSDPHAPITKLKVTPELAKACAQCHPNIPKEMKAFPSKHMQVACASCHHTKHGYIPDCLECHKPHREGQTTKQCLVCHPAHTPLNIKFTKQTPNEDCKACHQTEYHKIAITKSKHHNVACVQCHTKHKEIPKCERCHGKPHGASLHAKFPNCLQCHIDVHNLPIKR